MNLVPGRSDGSRFRVEGAALALPAEAPGTGDLILGLRPEHVEMRAPGEPGWPMAVEMIEMLGAERLVHGRIGSAEFTVRVDATLPSPKVGDTVALRTGSEHLHWFDPQTRQRV
jgi:sn-glycerol 3-phosphate transport system ATP-binding protein